MNNSWLAHSGLEEERKYEGSTVIRTRMYLSKLSFNGIKLVLLDCPGDIISFKWLWNTRNCCTVIWTFRTLIEDLLSHDGSGMLCPLKCLPSTHMYLFLHSWELFLGKALASRTEITCLSHLQDTQKTKTRKLFSANYTINKPSGRGPHSSRTIPVANQLHNMQPLLPTNKGDIFQILYLPGITWF